MICSVRSAICQAANATATATVPATAHQGTGRFLLSPPFPPSLACWACWASGVSLVSRVSWVSLVSRRKPGQLAGSWRTAK